MHQLHELFIVLASLVMVFAIGCTEEEPVVPEGLIPRDEFVAIMADIQLVEALAKQKMIRNDDPEVKLAEYYGAIYSKYGIADSTFIATYDWYHRHPDELLEVYDEVLNRLSRVEEELKQGGKAAD